MEVKKVDMSDKEPIITRISKKSKFKSGIEINKTGVKKLKLEFRMYIAEVLLNWAFSVSPSGKDGDRLKVSIMEYFNACVEVVLSKKD